MSEKEININPVTHITIDAIGKPGKRVFYLQAWHENQVITLLVEKIQIQTLALGIQEFLKEIHRRFENLAETTGDYKEDKMHIHPPVDPLFRVSEFGIAYETDQDKIILVARDLPANEPAEEGKEDTRVIRLFCTRSQIHALSRWSLEVSYRGRQRCPQCGEPMDPEGHFCPKKNGHKS